jgi:hypothetical protein
VTWITSLLKTFYKLQEILHQVTGSALSEMRRNGQKASMDTGPVFEPKGSRSKGKRAGHITPKRPATRGTGLTGRQ